MTKIINSSDSNFSSTFLNMEFKSFRATSKAGGSEWAKLNRHKWTKRTTKQLLEGNYAIPTGMVNNIVVVDMDLYKVKEGESKFIDTFGEDYIVDFNTFSVKTGSGGEHMYFIWDKEIRQTTCAEHQIDIRNGGGFVIAPGSSFMEGKKYTILHEEPIKIMPEPLKKWLLDNIYGKKKIIKKGIKKDKKGEIVNPKTQKDLQEQDEVDLSAYNYYIPDFELDLIVEGLPDKYFLSYQDWLIFTTCMRTIDRKDKWEEYNKKYIPKEYYEEGSSWDLYKETSNWDRVNYKYISTLTLLLRESKFITDKLVTDKREKYFTENKYMKARDKLYEYLDEPNADKYGKDFWEDPFKWLKKNHKDFFDLVADLIDSDAEIEMIIKKYLGYVMYKPTNNHTIQADIYIDNQRYLDGDTPGSFFKNRTERYVIVKSDTGTGKTTAMKNYILDNNTRFISIVSRLSLGKEQHKVFKEADIECEWFKDVDNRAMFMYEGDNMIIQIDSILKLHNWDFTGYTIYLDEFNSLIEYFLDCPTLQDKRICVKEVFENMILTAEYVYMTDAHISDTSLLYLRELGVTESKIFIQNNYKHNKGIKATEIRSDNNLLIELIGKYKNKEPFMVCCDSKNIADVIWNQLGKNKDIGLFTSETMIDIDLDAFLFVIFSPKVVYGLDSLMERPVYAVMKEHTISPLAMVQQVNRCRKITEIKYLFCRKSHGLYKYENVEEVLTSLNKREVNSLNTMKLLSSEEDQNRFKKILAHHLYQHDCMDTNKFAHFRMLLQGQGVILNDKYKTAYILQQWNQEIKKVKDFKQKELLAMYEEHFEYMCDTREKYIKEHTEPYVKELNKKNNMSEWDIKIAMDHSGKTYNHKGCITLLEGVIERVPDRYLHINKDVILDKMPYPQYVKNNIKLLKIQPLDVDKYTEILVDNHKIITHFLICRFYFIKGNNIINKLLKNNDYNCKKGSSPLFKLIFLEKVMGLLGCKKNENEIRPINKIEPDTNKKLLEEYRIVFNDRNKKTKISFDIPEMSSILLIKMFKNVFGSRIIKGKKSTKKDINTGKIKSHTTYSFDPDRIIFMSECIYDAGKDIKLGNEGEICESNNLYTKIKY
tara:strand:- start:4824 stop:8126 length:3303 start_codon:yes stop_codon:yes gene_type:complete